MKHSEVIVGRHKLLPFRQLQIDQHPISIGNKALQILSALAAARGEIVTKSELMDIVWSGLIVEENALQVHVASLRKALGDDANLLVTVRGLGYRLDNRDFSGWSGAFGQRYSSIAVLAFTNMTGNPQLDYLGEGLAEEVINALSAKRGLKVTSRTSSFAYKNRNIDARNICEELGVSALLEGSVRVAGGLARVTAQLIDAGDGTHVWSQNFDHEFADLFALHEDITAGVARSLERYLQPASNILDDPRAHINET